MRTNTGKSEDSELSSKQRFIKALRELPDTATLDDIEDRVWLLMKIERGLEDVDAGRGIPQEEVERYFLERYGLPVHEHEELGRD
jgi:predicted transcriptional regulator